MTTHDWRLAPLAAAAWAGAWLGSAGLHPGWGPILAASAALLVIALGAAAGNRLWLVLVVVVLVMTTVLTFLRALTIQSAAPARLAADGAAATVVVTMVGDPWTKEEGTPPLTVSRAVLRELYARDVSVSTRQAIRIVATGALAGQFRGVVPGASYEVRGVLAPAERESPEALVVRARWLSEPTAPPGVIDRAVNAMRSGLRASTAHSPPLQAALVPSLVVGDTSAITAEMDAQFKATSLSHLMAVSGANLSLMLVVLLALTRACGVRGWWVRVVAAGGVTVFVLICRGEPSVVRAAAMGIVAVSATGAGRGKRSVRALALAVLCLMMVDPWLARSWGFALSVSACLGIALWSPAWIEALCTWAPRWLAEALAIPLAAQLATQPLVTALSGRVSVVGVLANALVGPFVGPATVVGLAAMCSIWLPGLPGVLGWLAGWCVQPIITVAHVGSSLPSAAWQWPTTPTGIVVSVLTSLALASTMVHALRKRITTAVLVIALCAASWVRPVAWGWPGSWQAVFCDVGQGDATVLRAGEGSAVLVDTGPDPGAVLACLGSLHIRHVPMVVLTHFHADHAGGLAAVVDRYSPQLLLISPFASPPHTAAKVAALAATRKMEVVVAETGQRIDVGDVSWTTVAARNHHIMGDGDDGRSSIENDSSVVGVVEVADLRVLLPGDVEPSGQREALVAAAARGMDLRAHVLKLPHHGSSRQEERFFAATGAVLAVASAGEGNDYGHPSRTALELAMREGMAVARTDTDGAIAVALAGTGLGVRRTGS